MCDKLVYDLAQEIEGSPNIFIKKDWLNILDNQNGNYSANQCVIDTSQLSNSNKYMSYREAYLSVPLLLTLTCNQAAFAPATAGTSCDYAVGLKNWFGSIIHSFTLDYNGTTIIQQTPFVNMWNAFKLMTTLSWSDIQTMGATIGFYPDDPLSWSYNSAANTASGRGVCNNTNLAPQVFGVDVSGQFNSYKSNAGNIGFLKRQTYINYDPAGVPGSGTYAALLTSQSATNLWKSYISQKANGAAGAYQVSIRATIYLKHIHSFFQMIPLLKGVYMKMTLNLNNASCVFTSAGDEGDALTLDSTTVPIGGVQPIMVASKIASNGGAVALMAGQFTCSLSVGSTCLNSDQRAIAGVQQGTVGPNIFLYVPAYTFNPPFEQAYLSSPIKTVDYTDIYQYQIPTVSPNGNINFLCTNGIAGVKSVLVLPFFSSIVPGGDPLQPSMSQPVYQSPFDPAGCGATSPLCLLSNFNVVVSGQNAIYNTERYAFEQFNNQLYGANAVNGGQTDGITSGLIDAQAFEMEYCYYYVDISRMLPIEESVPKSVSIIGQNSSALPLSLFVFIEYHKSVSLDLLTGARV